MRSARASGIPSSSIAIPEMSSRADRDSAGSVQRRNCSRSGGRTRGGSGTELAPIEVTRPAGDHGKRHLSYHWGMAGLFRLTTEFQPKGDQPEAIRRLVEGIRQGRKHQVLLGVTGSGKTFTMAKVVEAVERPTLVLSHNKTLAAQLYQEFRRFFPDNAVEYFVSYYDYYQPEAYVPATDSYIEKEATINEEIDRMRHSATRSLFERRDVVIVASVSCIY